MSPQPLRTLRGLEPDRSPEKGRLRWLVSYADMVTLLFALFLIFFALSQTHPESLPRFVGGLRVTGTPVPPSSPMSADGPPSAAVPPAAAPPVPDVVEKLMPTGPLGRCLSRLSPSITPIEVRPAPEGPPAPRDGGASSEAAKEKLRAELEESLSGELLGVAEVHSERRGVVVALLDTPLLFESGKAELKVHGKKLLGRLVPIALRSGLPMRVEGHTDDIPIHNPFYKSNWELSVMRSAWVIRNLVELGIAPERLAVMGYGSTRPRYSNALPTGRAGNRRVEIVFLLEASSPTTQPPLPPLNLTSSSVDRH